MNVGRLALTLSIAASLLALPVGSTFAAVAQAPAAQAPPPQVDPSWASAPAASLTLADADLDATAAATESGGQVVVPRPPPDPSATPLTFNLTPYGFISAIGVNVRGGPNGTGSYTADVSFLKLLSHLKFGFMSGAEVGYGRWGAVGDLIYANVSFPSTPSRPILSFISARTTVKELISTVEGRYRLVDQPGFQLDALAGMRILSVDTAVNVFLPRQTLSGGADTTQVLPIVGARARAQLTRKWSALAYADGGGIGSAYSWQAYGGVSYHTSRHWDLAIGYRYYDMDFSSGPQSVNIAMYGPMVSGTYWFGGRR